jgi:glycosyltransferase involved in cell wall biosynthesis
MNAAYSVVIPAFNAEATLGAAIHSVLQQTPAPAEIVVVDDGSTDGTARVAAGFGPSLRYLHQANSGPGAATTLGFQAVTTPLVATLDADDLWLPGKIERQIAHFASMPELAAGFTLIRQFCEERGAAGDGAITRGWSRSTMLMRATLFAKVGPMRDPPGRRGEFVDWLARAREGGACVEMLDEVLVLRRVRAGSLSDQRGVMDRGYTQVARAAIERRRSKGAG